MASGGVSESKVVRIDVRKNAAEEEEAQSPSAAAVDAPTSASRRNALSLALRLLVRTAAVTGAVAALMYTVARASRRTIHSFGVRTDGAPSCDAVLDPADVSYTLVTQMSSGRLWMMGQHCSRWGSESHISVAVFTDMDAASVKEEILRQGGCTANRLAVSTLSLREYGLADYPVNRLRNLALSRVRTTHVVYVDVDFWESFNLFTVLNMPGVRTELARDPKLAVVLPAFQLRRLCVKEESCRDEQTNSMPGEISNLLELMSWKDASMFDVTNYYGHGSTSFGIWLQQKDGELFDIPCVKSERYEPYVVFRYCRDLPPFQEKFNGYGKNKMTFLMQLRRVGYDFTQLGGGVPGSLPPSNLCCEENVATEAQRSHSEKRED